MKIKRSIVFALLLCTVSAVLLLPAGAGTSETIALHPATGMFLVAAPQMRDPRFRETVILLVEHSAEGSLGFIVNRKTDLDVTDAIPELDGVGVEEHVLFFGGPVQPDHVAYVYSGADDDDGQKVFDSVHWGHSLEQMKGLLQNRGMDSLRIFFGYAGWAPGQLEFELSLDDWQLLPASTDYVFSEDTQHLWQILNRQKPGIMAVYRPKETNRPAVAL